MCRDSDLQGVRKTYLVTNKEGFQRNSEVNTVKSKTRQAFYDFLTEQGFIKILNNKPEKRIFLPMNLQEDWINYCNRGNSKFLNPFNDLGIRTVVLQTEGNIAVSQVDSGQEVIFKTKRRMHNPTGGGLGILLGMKAKKMVLYSDVEGTQLGKDVETKAKGLFISELSSPDDQREGWVDYGLGAVVYNVAHPFAKNLDGRSGIAGYYNMARVVISRI